MLHALALTTARRRIEHPLVSIEIDFATLYAEDVETWAELQVDALRRLAAAPASWANIIDWENVLEVIESLGSERRRAVEACLRTPWRTH